MGIQRRARQGLKEALKRGEMRDPATLPDRPPRPDRRPPLSQLELDRQETVKRHRDRLAQEFGFDPTLIATRSQVVQLARDPSDTSGFLEWQKDLLEPCLAQLK